MTRLLCALLGHRLVGSEQHYTVEVHCLRCHRVWQPVH